MCRRKKFKVTCGLTCRFTSQSPGDYQRAKVAYLVPHLELAENLTLSQASEYARLMNANFGYMNYAVEPM